MRKGVGWGATCCNFKSQERESPHGGTVRIYFFFPGEAHNEKYSICTNCDRLMTSWHQKGKPCYVTELLHIFFSSLSSCCRCCCAAAQQSFIADSFSCCPSVYKLLLGRGFVHLCNSGTELTKLRGQIHEKVPTSIFSSRLSGLKWLDFRFKRRALAVVSFFSGASILLPKKSSVVQRKD